MGSPYTPILGTLGYVLSEDRKEVLLMHRNQRKDDYHLGLYNGLGGKLESNEDPHAGMKREILEEANIVALDLNLRGVINFTNFGPHGENWLVFIYLVNAFQGIPSKSSNEGDLHWIKREKISTLPMWEGDKHFIPLVFDNDPRIFSGFMPYNESVPISWQFSR